jgi:hypothetical protein
VILIGLSAATADHHRGDAEGSFHHTADQRSAEAPLKLRVTKPMFHPDVPTAGVFEPLRNDTWASRFDWNADACCSVDFL